MAWLSNIFGLESEQERGRMLDEQLRALNVQTYGPGGPLYTPERWTTVQEHLGTSATGNIEWQMWLAGISAPIKWLTAPSEAWQLTQEGADIVGGAASQAVAGAFDIAERLVKPILRVVPWWVWLALAGFLAWRLGLFSLLRKRVS